MFGFPGCEQVGKSRTQHADWTRGIEAGLLRVQEQPRQTHLGDVQRSVPGGGIQYIQPCELCLSDRYLHGFRSRGKPYFKRRARYFHTNNVPPDSVCIEVHLVTPTECLNEAEGSRCLTSSLSPGLYHVLASARCPPKPTRACAARKFRWIARRQASKRR